MGKIDNLKLIKRHAPDPVPEPQAWSLSATTSYGEIRATISRDRPDVVTICIDNANVGGQITATVMPREVFDFFVADIAGFESDLLLYKEKVWDDLGPGLTETTVSLH